MKKFYFTFLFLVFGFLVSAQTSTEVGVTEGQLSVSLSGGANYTIPIAVPPGINGVVPQISLAYNSQGDNGIAGYGWNIGGISTISRIPSTKFHDGISDAVDFDNLDRFSLDGQRLIVKNGIASSYGLNETVYETEKFSNIKVTSYGIHSSGAAYGPAYFKVEYPDGSKAFYGNSTDSRSIADWALTYWENAQGIRISYSYSLTNNLLNIVSIKYGGRLESTPMNEIQFVYKTKQREEQSYVGGQLFIKNKILSDIKIIGNGTGFRNYSLSYDVTSLFYERLISITEKSGDNSKSYNPTIFEYENTEDTIFMQDSFTALSVNPTPFMPEGHVVDNTAENGGDDSKILGDFGMDNKFGLITFSSNALKRSNYIFYPNIDSNTTSAVGTKIYTKSIFDEIFLVNTLSGDASSGYKLKQNQNWCIARTNNESNLTTFSVFSNNSDGNSPVKLEHEINYTFPMYVTDLGRPDIEKAVGAIKTYLSGDFNGDNITDAIVIECGFPNLNNYIPTYLPSRIPQEGDIRITGGVNTSGGGVYFVNLDPRVTSNAVNFAGRLSGEFRRNVTGGQGPSSFFAADVNGDGKTDIIVTTKNIIDIYSLNENNIFVKTETVTLQMDNHGSIYNSWFALADYNGDGKIDYGPNLFSNGISFVPNSTSTFYSGGAIGSYIDFTNDGTTDLFSSFVDAGKVKFSSHINFFPLASKRVAYAYDFNQKPRYDYTNIYNKNTLSKKQIALYESVDNVNPKALRYLTLDKDLNKEKLLKSVTLGNGVKQRITYSSLINGNGVYTAGPLTENYPNQDIVNAPELKVVSKIEKQSASQYKKQLFFYSGAVTNLEGLGFLGFYSTVKTNWHDDSSPIISYMSKNDLSLRGANVENYEILGLYEPLKRSLNVTPNAIVKQDYTVVGTESLLAEESITLKPDTWIKPGSTFSAKINEEANNSPNTPTDFITKSRLTYESELLSNKVFKIKNTITKQFNGLDTTSSETYVVYDDNKNPLKTTTYLKEGGSTVQTTVLDVTYEIPTATLYVIGRPVTKNESVAITGDVMTSEELYFYENNLLTKIKKKGTNTDYITEDNDYDAFGNIIKKTITATGLPPRVTSYEYDASRRFLIKSTDIEKLSTTFDYNLSNGLLNSETNPYGLTTSYLYDSWFKKTATIDYLKNRSSYTYSRNGSLTIVTTSPAGGGENSETFDDLGRKVQKAYRSIWGPYSYVDYFYDIYDRNYKTSEPHFNSYYGPWNETKYDEYGRIKQSISATGKITDILYSGLTTTVSDGTKSKVSVKNAMGNVVSMEDKPGGTIKYTYFANGNLKESDYAGVKTTIKQDGWGRKTELNDLSAGIYTYDYNAFGEITETTTPNGTTTYTLDPFIGKLTQKTIKGTTTNSRTTYSYDGSSKLLAESTFEDLNNKPNTIVNSFTYDGSKRISKTIETTPYAVFSKEFTYDDFGRVNTEASTASAGGKSSSKVVKNTYKNGSHWQIVDNNTSAILWQTNTVNARGQLINAQNGPTTITNTYDDYGLASQFKYDKTTGSTNILTLNTVFDAKKGNLTSRTNSLFSRNESFKYDAQDRLTEFTNAQGAQEKQLYDDQGRITENSLGTYIYSKDNSYQNTSIDLTTEALDYYSNGKNNSNSHTVEVFNDDMEYRTGWSMLPQAPQCISFDDTKAHTGLNSIKISTTSAATVSHVLSDVPLNINNTTSIEYTFSGWIYTDNPTAELTLLGYNGTSTGYSYAFVDRISTRVLNKWTFVSKTILVPPATKSLRLRVGNVGIGNVWYDDVQIHQANYYSSNGENNNVEVFKDGMEYRKGWSMLPQAPQCISFDDTKAHTGNNSIKISTTLVTVSHVLSDIALKVNNTTNVEYTFSGWIYSEGPAAELTLLGYNGTSTGYNYAFVDRISTRVPNKWTFITKTILVPANIKSLRLRVGNVGYGNVWYDDVELKANNIELGSKSQFITYNAFKSPVLIDEKGIDKISFEYNDNNSRTAMFYGGLQDEKLERPLQKYYSADGSMEIKFNKATGVYEFITYIGGDGYSAPIVLKSNGTTQEYLYLQRDYQGSIIAITNQAGIVVEKRLFDAWGAIVSVQDGAGNVLTGLTVLDRGYTGHEHLQSVGLINMNGRIYDPKLHRFLQPDNNIQEPFNTQNYNRYGYVVNNPLKYTDPSGEIFGFILGFVFSTYVRGGAASGEANPFKWNSSTLLNAVTSTASSVGSYSATTGLNSYTDNYNNKPALGASAIGQLDNVHSFVNNENNSFDFKKANNITPQRPLIEQYSEHPREPYDKYDATGGLLTVMDTGLAIGEYKLYNPKTWYSTKMMKSYSQSFNGNGYTGGKVASALKISNRVKWAGNSLGAFNAGSILIDYQNEKINGYNFAVEEASNTYSTFGGIYGAAWGIGWETGRWLTYREFYQNWVNTRWMPWRNENLGY